jgi:hypothetical protein
MKEFLNFLTDENEGLFSNEIDEIIMNYFFKTLLFLIFLLLFVQLFK